MLRCENGPHIRAEEPDTFTPGEREAILDACREPQHRNLFQFAFWTGLRTSELIALEWRDVDWLREVVRVRRASVRKKVKATKTRAGERDVFLLPPALEALQEQREHTELSAGRIFYNPRTLEPWETDGQISKTAWAHILRRAVFATVTPTRPGTPMRAPCYRQGKTPCASPSRWDIRTGP